MAEGFLNPFPVAGWGLAGSGSAPAPANYGFRSPFIFAFGMAGNGTTPAATVTVPGGSGARYNVGNLDLETWRRSGGKLAKKVRRIQAQIKAAEAQIDRAKSQKRVEALNERLKELEKLLAISLADLELVQKAASEEDEVLQVYAAFMAWRKLN